MLQNSPASLASALDAGRDLSARFVFGAEQSVAWSELLSGSCLDRRASELRGRSILIETMDQLTAVSALIELDGVARRIVLYPPDLSREHLPFVASSAEADVIVSDRVNQ